MRTRLLLLAVLFSSMADAKEPLYDNIIFANSRMKGNYFYSKVSYTSPSWISNSQQRLPVSTERFFTPGNSLVLEYTNGKNGSWKATVLKPEWRGQDKFKPGTHLALRIFITSKTTAADQLPAIQIGIDDSTSASLPLQQYVRQFEKEKWITLEIPLNDFRGLRYNHSHQINSVSFVQSKPLSYGPAEIYVDEIEIRSSIADVETNTNALINSVNGYARHFDIDWLPIKDSTIRYVKIYKSLDGKNFSAVGIQHPFITRYTDFTGMPGTVHYKISFLNHNYKESQLSPAVSASTKEMNDEEFLNMIQHGCFRYYWDGAEKHSGLAKENIPGRHDMIATGASGFGIMALIVGTERKFISREESIERFLQITDFLSRTETFHGAFSHFVDGPTKKVEPFFGRRDNGGDLVETSFLIQGLLAARAYFDKDNPREKQIRDRITGIWERVEWDWYRRTPNNKYLLWHWSPDQEWVINHNLIGWNETMVTYLMAICSPTHPVTAKMYYTGWASQEPIAQQYRKNWGKTPDGSMYKNGKSYFGIPLPVGVSNGGPLFFVHYSYLGFDPHHITDAYTNYFENNRNIALINYRYCVENPEGHTGYSDSCWGLTAGDGPFRYSASEPVPRMDDGKMVPTGAIASFPYTPEQSMKALRNYYYNYGHFLWGEFGFRDAFNLSQNWCSEIFMGLNQGPMVVMIENHRSGLLWKLFMGIPEIKEGLGKLSQEKP